MSDEPVTNDAAPGRPPGWLIYVRVGAALVVVALIGVSVVLLRQGQAAGPRTVVLRGGDASPAPVVDAAAAAIPTTSPDGPLGALESGVPKVGQPAPDFALLDLEGRRVQLSALRGKAVVVNFWATWCGPCRQEFPELQKVAATMNDQVVVLALDQAESAGKVEQFRDEFNATFTILLDSRARVANGYKLSGIPDTIFVDRDGIVRDVAFGPLSAGTFRYKINQVVKTQ